MAAERGEEFKPGEKCRQSGIYKVVHDKKHYQDHEVTVVNGEPFPPCRSCGHGVRFVLTHLARHISTHEHFKQV